MAVKLLMNRGLGTLKGIALAWRRMMQKPNKARTSTPDAGRASSSGIYGVLISQD